MPWNEFTRFDSSCLSSNCLCPLECILCKRNARISGPRRACSLLLKNRIMLLFVFLCGAIDLQRSLANHHRRQSTGTSLLQERGVQISINMTLKYLHARKWRQNTYLGGFSFRTLLVKQSIIYSSSWISRKHEFSHDPKRGLTTATLTSVQPNMESLKLGDDER